LTFELHLKKTQILLIALSQHRYFLIFCSFRRKIIAKIEPDNFFCELWENLSRWWLSFSVSITLMVVNMRRTLSFQTTSYHVFTIIYSRVHGEWGIRLCFMWLRKTVFFTAAIHISHILLYFPHLRSFPLILFYKTIKVYFTTRKLPFHVSFREYRLEQPWYGYQRGTSPWTPLMLLPPTA
jgi:hypothetical protein